MDRNSLLKDFSYKLRKYRESLRYSHRRMAELFGTVKANYTRYENGKIFPNFFGLYYFAFKTGISLDWLVCNKGPMFYKEKIKEKEEKKEVSEEKKVTTEKEKPQPEPAGKIPDDEIKDLVDHMERIPLLRHEVLVTFYTFKEKHKEMVEAAGAE